ncbi:uncharacterized protein LOC132195725 isoform X2 [Neocloeon triangulifer]|uniref:uncharacterized protein LOC132195725 isoform X2 n=1 Tax=Neocloeon triangulifer TaxID=2078957 RepID=UPI00286F4719|nr:uncharacterized protein LOC132195725 isoform X2 [Neocloeon triangulifer]
MDFIVAAFLDYLRREQEEFARNLVLETARKKRSKVQNLRPLRELALQKIITFNRETCAETLVPFQHFPSTLRLEIIKRLQTQNSKVEGITPDFMIQWTVDLVGRLLDASVKEFDFATFSDGKDQERDLRVWRMLVERCPNLEYVADTRRRRRVRGRSTDENLRDVLPFVLQLPKLRHILLSDYICKPNDLTQIIQRFPSLVSLGFFCNDVPTLQSNLFTLQSLEVLKIKWDCPIPSSTIIWQEHEAKRCHCTQLGLECLKRLPRLRSSTFCIYGWPGKEPCTYQCPRQPLPLEQLDIAGSFDLQLVPSLKQLVWYGVESPRPMSAVSAPAFAYLTSLRVLITHYVQGNLIAEVLPFCGGRLEEIKLTVSDDSSLDICDVFLHCPLLHKFHIYYEIFVQEPKPFSHNLQASHFQNLQEFFLDWRVSHAYASKLLALVLTAPHLQRFVMKQSFTLNAEDCDRFSHLVVQERILQKLETFVFGSHREQPAELLDFLRMLPIYAPWLETMECLGAHRSFLVQMRRLLVEETLNAIDGFCFIDSHKFHREDYTDD